MNSGDMMGPVLLYCHATVMYCHATVMYCHATVMYCHATVIQFLCFCNYDVKGNSDCRLSVTVRLSAV